MADRTPQLENGYVRFATEWLEALVKAEYPGSVKDFVLMIARETWGWNETWREIAAYRLADLLGVSQARVKQLREEACRYNLVEWERGTGPGSHGKYRVQKDYLDWIARHKTGKWDARATSKDGLSGKDALSGKDGVASSGKGGLSSTSKDGLSTITDTSIDTLKTESIAPIGAVDEVARAKAEKASRDAARIRQQTERYDAAMAALTATDRELLDRMIAGQQLDPKRNGKPLSLLQQATQAEIYAKQLAEHGPECWRACCEISCTKEVYTAEYARGCTKNWKPNTGGGTQQRGLFVANADGTRTYERDWTAEQRWSIQVARNSGTWDDEVGIDRLDPRHPDNQRKGSAA